VTKLRAVQSSMFPDIQPDKPIGRILPSVFVGANADLIAAVAPFYLTGSVCDVTYGEGNWWQRFKPEPFVAHDKFKLDGVDFTDLPEADATFDAVTFDPPYIPQGGVDKSTRRDESFLGRFGLVKSMSDAELWTMVEGGLAESARVTKPGGYVLAKCMDFVNGGGLTLGHRMVLDIADRHRLRCHDLIVHHTGSGPGGHNIFDPKRARRNHSYLLVFERRGAA
jgi:ParB family chromosome partitioning protein